MTYQITDILLKAAKEDISFMVETLDSWVNFTDDRGMKKELNNWISGELPAPLAKKIEKEIRYVASNEVAYLRRKIWGHNPAGIEMREVITDVAKVCKVKLKPYSTEEAMLEDLAKKVVQSRIDKLSMEEQIELIKKNSTPLNDAAIDECVRQIKDNKITLSLPLLIKLLGQETAKKILLKILLEIIATFVGKEAAKQILVEISKKLPLQYLGPIAWSITIATSLPYIIGPAFRKTVPIVLFLGIISLRDGEGSLSNDGKLGEQ
jgi:uncharacterized protein YaaW (UPF0174 family)